jgi:hypothetical protein
MNNRPNLRKLLLLMVAAVLVFSGCTKPEPVETTPTTPSTTAGETFTVAFLAPDGSLVFEDTVPSGEPAQPPMNPIMPYGLDDLLTGNAEKTKALNLEFMRGLLPTAKREGVTICLENMPFPDFSISTPAAIIEIVKEIDDPNFAMCLDTGHTNVCRGWQKPASAMREYAAYIKVLHVHDNHKRRDEHLMPFYGSIDWKDFCKALCEVNFDGVLSLECAPSKKLPTDIMEDLYPIYFRIAKAICGE